MREVFVLVHSPLVGPFTWMPVRDELWRRGIQAIVPRLSTGASEGEPYWQKHVGAVAKAVKGASENRPAVLVGHSGAGPLLPAIGRTTIGPLAAYIFVDADIPVDARSRLDLFESPQAAEEFRRAATAGLLPPWREADLRDSIPDEETRHAFVSELQPVPLAVYEEPLPVFDGWPDAPCAYLRFRSSPAYESAHRSAKERGWAEMMLAGGHFLMLTDPVAVAAALVELVGKVREKVRPTD